MTTKTKQRYNGGFERNFDIGDLVELRGYEGEIWRVEGYNHTQYYYLDEHWTELEYKLAHAFTGDWLDGFEEDLTLIAEADHAEQFLRRLKRKKRRASSESTDALLDELADYMVLRETFGDEDYDAEVKRIKTRLKRQVERSKE